MELQVIKTMEPQIHSTAVIDPSAVIHKNVTIGPYTVIGPNCEIGEGTEIGPHVVIDRNVKIGRNNKIYAFAALGGDPQDLKFQGEHSSVVIGDSNLIREYTTIHRATGEGCETHIGSFNMLQAYVHVAHNCCIGNHIVISSFSGLAGHVTIEDRATVGGMVGFHQFVKVGRNSMIGGMSRIVQDICPFVIVEGNPARVFGLNNVSMARNEISPEVKSDLKKAYRLIFRSGLKLVDAIAEMEQELHASEEIEDLLRFLRNCDRGLCRTRDR